MATTNLPAVFEIPKNAPILPDKGKWKNRFEIKSQSSNNVYVVSQHEDGYWGCSCPAWSTRRECKHLDALHLPGKMQIYKPVITH